LEEKCKSLEEDLQKPPPNERLRSLVLQSDIDLFELLNFEKLGTIFEVKQVKHKLKEKLKERYASLSLSSLCPLLPPPFLFPFPYSFSPPRFC
jgi:hypothetical protein